MIHNLEEVLEGKKTVGIAGHVKPDGDCAGSCLGVYNYIKTVHPEITAEIFLEEIPPVFSFLHFSEEIISDAPEREPFDLFICLDCGDAKRLGPNAGYFENARSTLCIDHHISNSSFADENYIIPEASSTSELIFDLLSKEKITKEIAECLYVGIIHDTGVFQYSCTARSTMEAAGFLMERGIPFPRIIEETFFEKTYAENRIMGAALVKSELYANGRVIATILTEKEMAEVGATKKDTEGIVAQLRNTKGVEASIFLYQTGEGEFKLSLRSTEIVDCASITMKYGGGGHVRAAGATVKNDPEVIVREIVADMESQLKEAAS